MASKNGKGFIHILRPTPELWTLALPHRTQILYLADISFIVSWLGIKPGTVVVEAGTGSGSFSHSVARTIGPTGHLHTFEFHEARMLAAKEEFTRHGMSSFVTLKHQNVCRDGFGLTNVADAVFLDLPAPWDAIGSAKQALKKDCTTRICCFSPCIEQVLRTVSSLNDAGFTDITMYEVLIRPQDISATPSLRNIEEASDKLKASAIRREARRLRQIEQSRLAYEAKQKAKELESVAITDGDVKILTDTGDISPGLKRKREDETPVIMLDAIKRPKSEAVDTDAPNGMDIDEVPASHPVPKISPSRMDSPAPNSHSSTPGPSSVKVELMNVSRPFAEVRGHTSYLTFAVLLPATFPQVQP
ncbi:tRNA (adenine-N(1)-)-methyltransferase catalytic subunit trm61 [Tulasnella sp. 418]|nr:tRNA (adenine-N(1)-)-methyltransferase catalytic subunit trm61 [Tulasnella sp. 418]